MMVISQASNAQILGGYSATQTNGVTFVPLGATGLHPTWRDLTSDYQTDDNLSNPVNIGFNFVFNGVARNRILISTNGFITFNLLFQGNGNGSHDYGYNNQTFGNSDFGLTRNAIAPFYDDLVAGPNTHVWSALNNNIFYKTAGAPGSRTFTVEWKNMRPFGQTGNLNFQVKLYEFNNSIEFDYGTMNAPNSICAYRCGLSSDYVPFAAKGVNIYVQQSANSNNFDDSPGYMNYTLPNANSQIRFLRASIDIGISRLNSPAHSFCFSANEQVGVQIYNGGTSLIDFAATPLGLSLWASFTQTTTINSGTLAPGATQIVNFPTSVNMSTTGTYNLDVTASLSGDMNLSNNSFGVERICKPFVGLPSYFITFDGYDNNYFLSQNFPGWTEMRTFPNNIIEDDYSSWTAGTGLQNPGNTDAIVNLCGSGHQSWIVSQVFDGTTVTSASRIELKVAVTNHRFLETAAMGQDDSVNVMVSTNCGQTWNRIYSFNVTSGLTNDYQNFTIPLSAFAGQNIVVGFYATDGNTINPTDCDFHIDDITIGTPSTIDMAGFELIAPSGCPYTANEPIVVQIKNFGSSTINFAMNNCLVKAVITGPITHTATLTSGTLAPGATQNINLGTINMSNPGVYQFDISTNTTGESNPANDQAFRTRWVFPHVNNLSNCGYTGFTGANIATVCPNFLEGKGNSPVFNNSANWISQTGVSGVGNITARIYMHSTLNSEWIFTPSFLATSGSQFSFSTAITDHNSIIIPDTMGKDDVMRVLCSIDCGQHWIVLKTFDWRNNLSPSLTPCTIPLGNYAGREIVLAFRADDGWIGDDLSYDFHVDNAQVPLLTEIDEPTFPENSDKIYATIGDNNQSLLVNLNKQFMNGGEIILYDISGRIIIRKDFGEGSSEIIDLPVSNLSRGLYLISVSGSARHENIKIIKY